MEYGVDFNRIRKFQLVGIRRNNLFDFIGASVLPIKFLSKPVYFYISYI
jgi:hypothetical protein